MALDSKLRGCELVKLIVSDVAYGSSVSSRAMVLQQKTGSPMQFEITKGTREAVAANPLSPAEHNTYELQMITTSLPNENSYNIC